MVYKRYIKRDGKTFGPYYYESYRDDKGRTRTKLVKNPQENKKIFSKLSSSDVLGKRIKTSSLLYLIVFLLILTAGFFILNKNIEGGSPESSFEEGSPEGSPESSFEESSLGEKS